MNCERSRAFQKPDYLLDKFYASTLSDIEAEGQGQSARTHDALPIWECVEGDIEMETRFGFVVPTFNRERKSGPATLRRRLWIVPYLTRAVLGRRRNATSERM